GSRRAGGRLDREPTRQRKAGLGLTYTEFVQEVLDVPNDVAVELAGVSDGILESLRDRLDCTIRLRGNRLTIEGDENRVTEARAVVEELMELVEGGRAIRPSTVR